jgi:ATP-binding cassette subfamily F protein 3
MLQFNELALRRGARLLFEQATFQVHPGQKVGLTGANGCGKSSLLALVLGELHSDQGDFQLPKDWVIAHVAQAMSAGKDKAIDYVLDGDAELRRIESAISLAETQNQGELLAVLHGQYETMGGYSARSRAGQLLNGLGFKPGDENRAVNEFSGGWRMRLNLAQALMCQSDLLLLDEPTNHLDLDAVIWLESWLCSYSGTMLLISHDRDFLDRVTTHIAQMEQQRITLYTGNYTAFERVRAERLANQQAAYVKQQHEIEHIRSYVDRFRAKASKARQAQSRLKALERMEQIVPAHVDSPFNFVFRKPDKVPTPLLQLKDISSGYNDVMILSGLNLDLTAGDRIGLLGRNGAGKSTLIKVLAGELSIQQGERLPAKDLAIGYFAQHQIEQLQSQHSPLDHLKQLDPTAREQDLRNFLGSFGFSNDQALAIVEPFSGGEKSRLVLALLVYQKPNLLLLDEPTNHLDLEMRQALALALQDFPGAIVLVSHDRHLLRITCDRLILVHDGGADEFQGSLDEYPQWLVAQARQEKINPQIANSGNSANEKKQKKRQEAELRKQQQPLRKIILKTEKAMENLQARSKELENKLTDSTLYNDDNKQQLKTLLAEKSALDKQHADLETNWLEVHEQLEQM